MNETQTKFNHHKPSRLARTLVNALVTTILHSRWHDLMSQRLLLITFTGRNSGKKFTTPIRYKQEGETLQIKIVAEYSWWKNLIPEQTVHILLRRQKRTGTAEVLAPEGELVVVKIHLKA
ncbi:MAG TPA: nitroreductase/quinone reductase family protein [Ktedonobacteraceae bacterium]|nr:nitroreductase/quinone reductase family protein [Ktedonobacteraceae bacterium]